MIQYRHERSYLLVDLYKLEQIPAWEHTQIKKNNDAVFLKNLVILHRTSDLHNKFEWICNNVFLYN